MKLKVFDYDFTICKVKDIDCIDFNDEFCFFSKTDEEISLVCRDNKVPHNIIDREDNWKGLRIDTSLDFSFIGIIFKISKILAENKIGIFVVSTYNTDYIFVKSENLDKTLTVLKDNGYIVTS